MMLQYPLLSRRLFTTAASPPSSIATITSALRALDIRLGHVRTVTAHPDADRLFVEQIDVGHIDSVQNRTSEDSATVEQRQIVSGLRAFMQVEDLCDRRVLVVCGMKRRKLRGIASHGMLLCAVQPTRSAEDGHISVDPLSRPKLLTMPDKGGTRVGEQLELDEQIADVVDAEAVHSFATIVNSKRAVDTLLPWLCVDSEGRLALGLYGGPLTASSWTFAQRLEAAQNFTVPLRFAQSKQFVMAGKEAQSWLVM